MHTYVYNNYIQDMSSFSSCVRIQYRVNLSISCCNEVLDVHTAIEAIVINMY